MTGICILKKYLYKSFNNFRDVCLDRKEDVVVIGLPYVSVLICKYPEQKPGLEVRPIGAGHDDEMSWR